MLVLTRKAGENVVINDDENEITITVLKVQGKSVSLGIKASSKWRIYRGELMDDNEEAEMLEEELALSAGASN